MRYCTMEYHWPLEKEWNPDTYYNMDEPCEYYAEWNKLYTKGQIQLQICEVPRVGKFMETIRRIGATRC